jgi:hypothetical protein
VQFHRHRFILRYLTVLLVGLACLSSMPSQAEARGRDYGQGYKSQWMNPRMWRPTRGNAVRALGTQWQGIQNYRRYGDHRGPGYARSSRSYSSSSYHTRSYRMPPPRTNWGSGRMGTLRRR